MRTAQEENKRFVPLFGADTFRSWISILCRATTPICIIICPPRPFWCFKAKRPSKDSRAKNASLEKMRSSFSAQRITIRLPNVGTEPLVLVGNRSEAFGGAHVRAKDDDS